MKLLFTTLFILISLCSTAQDEMRNVTIPFRVAKEIQKELVAKDSMQEVIGLMTEEAYLLGRNIQFKDQLIDTLTSNGLTYKSMYENEVNLKITYKGIAEDCKTQYDLLNNKYTGYKKFTKVVAFLGTAIVTALTVVILIVK